MGAMSVSDDRLEKAYRLIEADELGAARAILQPLLDEEPDNADAWWLYAHAVTDPEEARDALANLLRLDPDYPGAAELTQALHDLPAAAPVAPLSALESDWPDLDDTLPELTEEDEKQLEKLLEDERSEEVLVPAGESRRSSPVGFLAALAVILVILVAAVLLLRSTTTTTTTTPTAASIGMVGITEGTDEPTAEVQAATEDSIPVEAVVESTAETLSPAITQVSAEAETAAPTDIVVAQAPTELPTSMPTAVPPTPTTPPPTVTPTLVPPTVEVMLPTATIEEIVPASTDVVLQPSENEYSAIVEALAGFTVPEGGIGTAETSLGNTLLVTVCSAAGQQLRASLPTVMEIIATQVGAVPPDVQAIGARMFNCDTNRLVLIIVTPVEEARQYASGAMPATAFQQFWVPQ